MYLKPKIVLVFVLFGALFLLGFHFINKKHVEIHFRVLSRKNESYQETTPISPILQKVKQITNCFDKHLLPNIEQRGQFWVLSNYIVATRSFKCHESITITTQGDFTFLDNLVPLVKKWGGPVSIALYAPGTDFDQTINSIGYLRECTTNLIKELVTFHIFFDSDHMPEKVKPAGNVNCSLTPPFYVNSSELYKNQKDLLYPINVGRNVAREMSQTHFVLALDIELYPSPGIIPKFLEMIARNEGPFLNDKPRVFPLAIFEVQSDQKVPENKTQLQKMLSNKTAIYFHKNLCSICHKIPEYDNWVKANESESLNVFTIGKRLGSFKNWEPIYIGTNFEPRYDERLSWEGKSDKMSQGYVLCVLDYELMILDNAFLVHKPGIKTNNHTKKRAKESGVTHTKIKKHILPELKVLYGEREGCVV